jgi:hypothetical protein
LLVGAYGISIGFLLISAFFGVEFLNSEKRVSGNQYPAWSLGFGIGGIVLLSWAMITDVRWSRSNLVVRPDMPFDRYKLLIVSIGSGIFLITSLVTSILMVGFSAGAFGLCTIAPFTIILWLFSAIRCALGYRDGAKRARLPLLVNTIVIRLAVLLIGQTVELNSGSGGDWAGMKM